MTMSDEGIGDPMPRASEAWHGEWRRRSRGSATRPSGSYQKGTVGMEASSDVLLVNVCVRRVDEAVATSIQELYQKELSGAAKSHGMEKDSIPPHDRIDVGRAQRSFDKTET